MSCREILLYQLCLLLMKRYMENSGGQLRVHRDDTVKKTVEGVIASPSPAKQAQGDNTIKNSTQTEENGAAYYVLLADTGNTPPRPPLGSGSEPQTNSSSSS